MQKKGGENKRMNLIKKIFHVTLVVLVVSFLPAGSALGHGIERVAEEVQEGGYVISFETDPVYPVTGKSTHFDVSVKDDETFEFLSGLALSLELHRKESAEIITLAKGEEGESGHYGFSYTFSGQGFWEIHVVINGQKMEKGFTVDVDSFGLSGLLRSGIILILAGILVTAARRDCREKESVKEMEYGRED